MPDTKTVELRTDTIEQLIELLSVEGFRGNPPMRRDRRRAVADRLARQTRNPPDAIMLTGLPAAGKSHVADMLSQVYDAPVISMGDVIRADAPDGTTGEELGQYAATWRDNGPKEIPKATAEMAKAEASVDGRDLVIIDGVRSIEDYEVLDKELGDTYLIEVKTRFYKRLSRLQDRGREGEKDFNEVDLANRDLRERTELGLSALRRSDNIDMTIKNGTGSEQITISLSSVVENNLPFQIMDGKPLGLSVELEEHRRAIKAEQ